jgi:hypothetical protein
MFKSVLAVVAVSAVLAMAPASVQAQPETELEGRTIDSGTGFFDDTPPGAGLPDSAKAWWEPRATPATTVGKGVCVVTRQRGGLVAVGHVTNSTAIATSPDPNPSSYAECLIEYSTFTAGPAGIASGDRLCIQVNFSTEAISAPECGGSGPGGPALGPKTFRIRNVTQNNSAEFDLKEVETEP